MKNILLSALFVNALFLISGQQYFVTKIFSMPQMQSKVINYQYQYYSTNSIYQSGSFFQSGSFTSAPTLAPTLAPTFAPTFAPTLAPTLVPTFAPTFAPTLVPILVPTLAPTLVPTFAPTFAPTLVPTLVPTLAPTLAPTFAPSTILNFVVEGTLNNLSYTTLTQPDKQCIITATAKSMNISSGHVTFVENSRRKLLIKYKINYKTEVNYPLYKKNDATNVYSKLTNALIQSVSSGNFNNFLKKEAQTLGATNILNAVVANVSNSSYTVIVNKSNKNHKKNNIKNFLFFAFIIIAVPLTYIKCKECTKSTVKYNKRRNYYFNMLFSETAGNSENMPSNAI